MGARIATLPWGYIGTYDDNEIEIVSTIKDPPKVRVAVDESAIESNLGSFSWNKRRADGRHEEMGYIMGRLTADKQSAAMYLALRPPNDQNCREVLYIDSAVALFRVPVLAPNIGTGGRATRFYTDGGKFCVNMQDDADNVRAVKYRIVPTPEFPDIVTSDERTWKAVGEATL